MIPYTIQLRLSNPVPFRFRMAGLPCISVCKLTALWRQFVMELNGYTTNNNKTNIIHVIET